MADLESLPPPAEEVLPVRPKSVAAEGGSPDAAGGDTEGARDVQRRSQPKRRPRPREDGQEREQPQSNGDRSRRAANPRGQVRRERNPERANRKLPDDIAATRELRHRLVEELGREGLNPFNNYLKNQVELAKFKVTSEFLIRCRALSILPVQYRLSNSQVQNTLYMRRLLEGFSYQLMKAELRYSQKRCSQIERLLSGRYDSLKEIYDESLLKEIVSLVDSVHKRRYEEFLKIKNDDYQSLIEEYNITPEEVAEAEASLKRYEESRRKRRAEAEQRSKEPSDSQDAEGPSDGRRVFRRGPRRQNYRRPRPVPKDD
ncbi:uncharacterized protein LOC100898609 [Galendromus occidentalis]|uniref:Uncharacterized protein LOC100898609 n=1 Tax=Galendromus occidentalis TaxID=34638 RepID=A0AAJ6QUD4_9ACAR|nr:uncharacterized protein LOC100898609 [Galendromus occidentalis]